MPNPAYPTEYFNVMVTGAADIPSGGFILFYDKEIYNATEQRFMAISDLPLRDKKEVVFQMQRNTYGNPLRVFINMEKTLELSKK